MAIIDSILLPGSLFLIMLSMGLSLTIDDFKAVLKSRRALMYGTLSMLVVPPLVGTAMAFSLAPTPALAVGFILLATCPGGMLSNLFTDMAKGDLALSLSLSIVVSMIYIVVVPFYAHFAILHFMGVSENVDVPLSAFVWKIFSITLIPASLGILVRAYRASFALAAKGYIKNIATVVLFVSFGFILADQIPVLRENLGTLLWMTLGINVATLAIVLTVCKAFAFSLRETTAVGIEHLMRQEGTAIYVAVTIVGSREMSLPMIMNTPVALVICVAFVLTARSLITRREEAV